MYASFVSNEASRRSSPAYTCGSWPTARSWARSLVILLVLVAGSACKGEKAAAQRGTVPPPAVVVAEVTRRNVPIYGEWVAQTVANSTVDIPARV